MTNNSFRMILCGNFSQPAKIHQHKFTYFMFVRKVEMSEEDAPRLAPRPASQPQQPRIPSRSSSASTVHSHSHQPGQHSHYVTSPPNTEPTQCETSPQNVNATDSPAGDLKHAREDNRSKVTAVPNFFLPAADLAQNMRTITSLQPTRVSISTGLEKRNCYSKTW